MFLSNPASIMTLKDNFFSPFFDKVLFFIYNNKGDYSWLYTHSYTTNEIWLWAISSLACFVLWWNSIRRIKIHWYASIVKSTIIIIHLGKDFFLVHARKMHENDVIWLLKIRHILFQVRKYSVSKMSCVSLGTGPHMNLMGLVKILCPIIHSWWS